MRERLAAQGIAAVPTGGLVPSGASFVAAVVALLRAVAAVNGAGSIALTVFALVVLARDRSETVAVVRAIGGSRRHVAMLLGGAGLLLITLALVTAVLAQRLLLDPIIERLLGTYGVLDVSPDGRDLALTAVGAMLAAIASSVAVALRYSRITVRRALHAE